MLLQNATAVLLENATKVYYKFRQVFYYKNVIILLQNATVIAKCDCYYKMERLLQIATVRYIT